jgi:hypothetical protein
MGTASFFAYPTFSTDNKFSKQKRYSGQRDQLLTKTHLIKDAFAVNFDRFF